MFQPITERQRLLLETSLVLQTLREGGGDEEQRLYFEELEWRWCESSYTYWRDNYAKLMLKSGRVIDWTDPFPMQDAQGEAWQRGDSTIEVKSRQLGETTNASHFCLWDCMFHDAVKWNIFGADEDAGKDVVDRLNATIDRLPRWMLDRSRMTPGGVARAETENKSRKQKQQGIKTISFGLSKLEVRTGSVAKAQGLAGKVLVDDFGKHSDQGRKWQLMYPVIDDPDPENRGQVVIIFNGNGEDFGYHLYQKGKAGELPLKASFFNWMEDRRRLRGATAWGKKVFKKNGELAFGIEELIRAYREEALVCPWYDDAQRNYLIENPDADVYAFKAQFPTTEEEAFYLHGNSYFDLTTINAWDVILRAERAAGTMRTGFMEAGSFREHPKGKLRLYEEPKEGESYVIGVDAVGSPNSGDNAVVMVCKQVPDGLEQVAVFQAKVSPIDLASTVEQMGVWYNDALVVVETGSSGHGQSVVNHIKDRYFNLYRAVRSTRWLDEEREEIGWATSGASRDLLLADVSACIGRHNGREWEREPTFIFHDYPTLMEFNRFEIDPKSGKPQAAKGMNDDLVMACGFCLQGAKSMSFAATPTLTRSYKPWEC